MSVYYLDASSRRKLTKIRSSPIAEFSVDNVAAAHITCDLSTFCVPFCEAKTEIARLVQPRYGVLLQSCISFRASGSY